MPRKGPIFLVRSPPGFSILTTSAPISARSLEQNIPFSSAKLSKRHGATSIAEYREQGYLPEAMVNFLALLGWSLDDRTELFSQEELVNHFSLERLSKTAAIFNIDKLNWMNGVYLRRLNMEEFSRRAIPFLEKGLPSQVKRPLRVDYVRQIMPLVQERAKTLGEVPELTEFFFVDELSYNTELLLIKDREVITEALAITLDKLRNLEPFDTASLEALLRLLAAELGLKTGEFFSLLRVATTGRTAAPPLFHTMAILGKERCLRRIEAAIYRLQNL